MNAPALNDFHSDSFREGLDVVAEAVNADPQSPERDASYRQRVHACVDESLARRRLAVARTPTSRTSQSSVQCS